MKHIVFTLGLGLALAYKKPALISESLETLSPFDKDTFEDDIKYMVHAETGEESILQEGLPVTELFTSRDGQWLGYTSARGHFSYNLHRLKLRPPDGSDSGFPSIIGEPEQLTFATLAKDWIR